MNTYLALNDERNRLARLARLSVVVDPFSERNLFTCIRYTYPFVSSWQEASIILAVVDLPFNIHNGEGISPPPSTPPGCGGRHANGGFLLWYVRMYVCIMTLNRAKLVLWPQPDMHPWKRKPYTYYLLGGGSGAKPCKDSWRG